MTLSPSPSPLTDFTWWANPPTPTPAPTPTTGVINTPAVLTQQSSSPPPPRLPVDFSPPLIAMVVVVAAAFLVVTYSRLISRHVIPPLLRLLRRRRRRRASSAGGGDLDSLPYYDSPFDASDGFHVLSPYGLDDSVIKTIPLSIYTTKRSTIINTRIITRDCAVCLIEFDEDDYVRTLPLCSHAFHVDCIDMWLRSHANCPLCRTAILGRGAPDSPFVPLMAARIRPSLDDAVLRSIAIDHAPPSPPPPPEPTAEVEITPCVEEIGQSPEERGFGVAGRDFLLKRSYSFGFERSAASERMMMMATEPATASPWRYHGGRRVGGFWSKRPSPFGSLGKPRVFSFRYYRGMKSPFFRRSRGFFPLSESSSRFSGGGGSSRRTKSMTSPMFMRPSAATATAFSSSRLRCGDPEALLSPERFNPR